MIIPNILIISSRQDGLEEKVQKLLDGKAKVFSVPTGLMGLAAFMETRPLITIVDDEVKQLNGCTVTTMLKDNEQIESCFFLLVHKQLLPNTKADRFIDAKTNSKLLLKQIETDFDRIRASMANADDGLNYAVYNQEKMLPQPIHAEKFDANYVFSAFDRLSGDSVNFWYSKDKDPDHLYGYLFDCEGHNVASFGQVGSTWLLLRKRMEEYQNHDLLSLAEVMNNVNQDYYRWTPIKSLVPAIVFCFDFREKELHFCPAGIPNLYVRKKKDIDYEQIDLKSSIVGYSEDSVFEEKVIPIGDVSDVMFTTDGLSDILSSEEVGEALDSAKHDDMSAIHVNLTDNAQ